MFSRNAPKATVGNPVQPFRSGNILSSPNTASSIWGSGDLAGLTYAANNALGPTGALDADTCVMSSASNYQGAKSTSSLTISTAGRYLYRVVCALGKNNVVLRYMGILIDKAGNYVDYAGMNFDLAAGFPTTGIPSNGGTYATEAYRMIKLPHNYYSLEIEMTLAVASTHILRLSFTDQAHLASGGVWTGDGVSELHFWGAELSPLF